jgi:hypothetical protein
MRAFPRASTVKQKTVSRGEKPPRTVVVTYEGGRIAFVFFGAVTLLMLGLAVYFTVVGKFLGFVLAGVACAFGAYRLTKQCHRIELWSDGSMVLHFFLRPNRVATVRAISEIKHDGEIGEFEIVCRNGAFAFRSNNSGKALVHALVKMNYGIRVRDYAVPPL